MIGLAEESSCESLGCPDLVEGDARESLRLELRTDESLRLCRDLADGASLGYKWEDGLMYHTSLDPNGETVRRMVLPASVRIRVLKVCHEHYGHTEQAFCVAWYEFGCCKLCENMQRMFEAQ